MGNDDVQALKDSVGKVETKIDGLNDAIADLRVLIAGNYVTKEEFQDFQKTSEDRVVALHKKVDTNKEELQEEIKANKGYPAWMVVVFSLLTGLITYIVTGAAHIK